MCAYECRVNAYVRVCSFTLLCCLSVWTEPEEKRQKVNARRGMKGRHTPLTDERVKWFIVIQSQFSPIHSNRAQDLFLFLPVVHSSIQTTPFDWIPIPIRLFLAIQSLSIHTHLSLTSLFIFQCGQSKEGPCHGRMPISTLSLSLLVCRSAHSVRTHFCAMTDLLSSAQYILPPFTHTPSSRSLHMLPHSSTFP